MQKVSNHTFKSTAGYLEKMLSQTIINYVPFEETLVNSLDVSVHGLIAFGLLKRGLGRCNSSTF